MPDVHGGDRRGSHQARLGRRHHFVGSAAEPLQVRVIGERAVQFARPISDHAGKIFYQSLQQPFGFAAGCLGDLSIADIHVRASHSKRLAGDITGHDFAASKHPDPMPILVT